MTTNDKLREAIRGVLVDKLELDKELAPAYLGRAIDKTLAAIAPIVEELEKDWERLDWLLSNASGGVLLIEDFLTGNRDVDTIEASRTAIDAARTEAKP